MPTQLITTSGIAVAKARTTESWLSISMPVSSLSASSSLKNRRVPSLRAVAITSCSGLSPNTRNMALPSMPEAPNTRIRMAGEPAEENEDDWETQATGENHAAGDCAANAVTEARSVLSPPGLTPSDPTQTAQAASCPKATGDGMPTSASSPRVIA